MGVQNSWITPGRLNLLRTHRQLLPTFYPHSCKPGVGNLLVQEEQKFDEWGRTWVY